MRLLILPSGHLQLDLEEEDRDLLAERLDTDSEISLLCDLTESYWTNGGFEPFDAAEGNPNVGLTCAPCIAERMIVHEDGRREVDGRLWWFPAYETVAPLQELLKNGTLQFDAAQAPEPAPSARKPRPGR